jgi:hypothetical protein
MATAEPSARIYQELAKWYEDHGEPPMRDRFLVLAADAFQSAGGKDEAERLRARLLQLNPHHLLRPFPSLAEAMKSTDVKNYIEGLRRNYPREKAVQLLQSLRDKAAKPAPGDPSATVRDVLKTSRESPGTFGLQDDNKGKPAAPVRPTPSPPLAETKRGGPELAPGRTNLTPGPIGTWPQGAGPAPWRNRSVDVDAGEAPAGAWVATILFWLVLLAGLALMIFPWVRPLLPM